MAIDSVHDEIVVPNPFAQAILFFRGGASGNGAPIRVIQGPKTKLDYTDHAAVDPVHGEVYVSQPRTNSILVFNREPGGDVEPIRIIHGPKTKLDRPHRVAIDPVNNLIAVTTLRGVWIFNRADKGDVAPRWVISGPKTRIGDKGDGGLISKAVFYPPGKKILVAGGRGVVDPSGNRGMGIVGIWNYEDLGGRGGDIAPWAMLTASATTGLDKGGIGAQGLDINPKAKEIMLSSGGTVFFFYIPEIFE